MNANNRPLWKLESDLRKCEREIADEEHYLATLKQQISSTVNASTDEISYAEFQKNIQAVRSLHRSKSISESRLLKLKKDLEILHEKIDREKF